ncbi:hypothetical protein JCM6294_38 [Bacteroides pyogenes DSM 20611 = JCM 6294]|uniref:Uncharacterized protein n=1 Tax=Bacteroides pyogenes DSM 20611 = JCM 6294 TaxID=1121100 RepID=W4PC49_9BACE|nr:hypothetical protein JCM6294_38 [Bacteroides pyogenes DSM 20611 = JCM 6294]
MYRSFFCRDDISQEIYFEPMKLSFLQTHEFESYKVRLLFLTLCFEMFFAESVNSQLYYTY